MATKPLDVCLRYDNAGTSRTAVLESCATLPQAVEAIRRLRKKWKLDEVGIRHEWAIIDERAGVSYHGDGTLMCKLSPEEMVETALLDEQDMNADKGG